MVDQGGRNIPKPVNLKLCHNNILWVDIAEYLEHALYSDSIMRQDIGEKCQFIDRAVKISLSAQHTHLNRYMKSYKPHNSGCPAPLLLCPAKSPAHKIILAAASPPCFFS